MTTPVKQRAGGYPAPSRDEQNPSTGGEVVVPREPTEAALDAIVRDFYNRDFAGVPFEKMPPAYLAGVRMAARELYARIVSLAPLVPGRENDALSADLLTCAKVAEVHCRNALVLLQIDGDPNLVRKAQRQYDFVKSVIARSPNSVGSGPAGGDDPWAELEKLAKAARDAHEDYTEVGGSINRGRWFAAREAMQDELDPKAVLALIAAARSSEKSK